MPRYAISDIHGCSGTFARLLDRIGLRPTDELYLLGDYIDRGPDSFGVLEKVWQLQSEGYHLTCLRGNHEAMLLEALRGGSKAWDYYPTPERVREVNDWMTKLPYYAETPGYLLVHAGLNFGIPDPLRDTEAMLWARYWEAEIDTDWLGDRILVYGHTPRGVTDVREGVRHMRSARRVCIDSGCAMRFPGMGHLTALDLDSGEVIFEPRCD